MWIITKDHLFDPAYDKRSAVGVRSVDFPDGPRPQLLHQFRLLDDDGVRCYDGHTDVKDSFAPKDDFGEGAAGCTIIQYQDDRTRIWYDL